MTTETIHALFNIAGTSEIAESIVEQVARFQDYGGFTANLQQESSLAFARVCGDTAQVRWLTEVLIAECEFFPKPVQVYRVADRLNIYKPDMGFTDNSPVTPAQLLDRAWQFRELGWHQNAQVLEDSAKVLQAKAKAKSREVTLASRQ